MHPGPWGPVVFSIGRNTQWDGAVFHPSSGIFHSPQWWSKLQYLASHSLFSSANWGFAQVQCFWSRTETWDQETKSLLGNTEPFAPPMCTGRMRKIGTFYKQWKKQQSTCVCIGNLWFCCLTGSSDYCVSKVSGSVHWLQALPWMNLTRPSQAIKSF